MWGIAVWFTDVGPGIVVWFHHTAHPTCSLFLCSVKPVSNTLQSTCFCALYTSEQHPYMQPCFCALFASEQHP